MAIYTSKTKIDLEDVGYSNKITNKAILKILENKAFRTNKYDTSFIEKEMFK